MVGDQKQQGLAPDTAVPETDAVSPPAPRKIRGQITQILVFVNGLILSVTAFLTLNIFMTQMRSDYSQDINDQVINATENIVRYLVRDMRVLSQMAQADKTKALVNRDIQLESLMTDLSVYDRVLLFSHVEGARWTAQDIYRNQDKLSLYSDTVNQSGDSYASAFLPLLSKPGQIVFKPLTDTDYNGFIALKGAWRNGKLSSVQAFFVNMESYYLGSQGFNTESIPQLSVHEAGSPIPIYTHGERYHNPLQTSQTINDILHKQAVVNVSGKAFTLELHIREDFRILFLSKIPYLIMLFGITLTMIGTLYVRNNQRQSTKLAEAASRLSEKNKVMNRQVQETERLYRVLQKSEREYSDVINSVSDILFEVSQDGEIQFLNQAWERITDIDKRQVIGENLLEFLDQEQHEKMKSDMELMNRGLIAKIEMTSRLKTAEKTWRTVEVTMIVNKKQGQDNDDKIIGTIKDIEDTTRANLALNEAEKKYQTIVENAAGGIYQAEKNGHLVSANPALARILGYDSANQLIDGLQSMAHVYVDDHDRQRYERELLDVGFIRNLETRMKRRDGQIIWVSENARAVKDTQGQIAYFEGSIEDITQRKQAEIALREAKIQSDLSSRAKSDFLANMSHELRTPLNAIIGFSEIIKTEAMGPLGQPAYSEYAGEIYGSGQKLLSVINEILDISKIEAGERALNEGLISLEGVVQSSLNMLVGKLDARHLTLINNLDGDLPNIVGEELSFKQILLNLLSNAIKFTPDGGQITLGYDYQGAGSDLTLSITDTGIGMDNADIPKIFSAFSQLDNTLDRSLSGTGLGLTLAKALIEMHGGHIDIISQKNLGTTVSVIIPARRISQGRSSDDSRTNVRVFNPKA